MENSWRSIQREAGADLMQKMYKQVAPMQMLERVAPDNIKSLTALLEATQKLKTGLARVATRDLVRRVFSREALCLLRDLKSHLVRCSPVVAERIYDAFRGLLAMGWRDASLANVANVLLDVLGGTFVKMAQVLAHSPGLLPPSLVAACRSSLSNGRGRAVGPSEVRAATGEVFGPAGVGALDAFDMTPLAVASIAQVHAATLAGSGEAVVVKLVRPGVRQRLSADLELCSILARFTDLLLGEAIVSDLLLLPYTHGQDVGGRDPLRDGPRLGAPEYGIVPRLALHLAIHPAPASPVPSSCLKSTRSSARLTCLRWRRSVGRCSRSVRARMRRPPRSWRARAWWWRTLSRARWTRRPHLLAWSTTTACPDGSVPSLAPSPSSPLSLVEENAIFHADLHMGNLIYLQESASMAFLDFGVCRELTAVAPWRIAPSGALVCGGRRDPTR